MTFVLCGDVRSGDVLVTFVLCGDGRNGDVVVGS